MTPPDGLWIVLTLIAAAAQTARNAMQKGLTTTLGTVGATQVRFLFGLPFAVLALLGVRAVTGTSLPVPDATFAVWLAVGALTQIAATALMLAAMRLRSFTVTTAYVKTEALQVALFAAIVLSEAVSVQAAIAIAVATAGVWLMSWPARAAGNASVVGAAPGAGPGAGPPAAPAGGLFRPALLGLAAGGLFAASAVGFKGAIVSLAAPSFVVAATVTLVCGLLLQSLLLAAWQAWRDPAVLIAIGRAWRPSLTAGFMGALASQMWFLAFAIASTAHVRTLGLVEILFAHALSRRFFAQRTTGRELAGIALVVGGTALLLNT